MAKELLLFFLESKIIYNRFGENMISVWWVGYCVMKKKQNHSFFGHRLETKRNETKRNPGFQVDGKNTQVMMITFHKSQIKYYFIDLNRMLSIFFSSKKHSIFRWLSIDQIIKSEENRIDRLFFNCFFLFSHIHFSILNQKE